MLLQGAQTAFRLNLETKNAARDLGLLDEDAFFVASSPGMQKIKAKVELLARVDVPVLICGESGSGREMVARLIHQLSGRAKHKFAKINCAALDADSLQQEICRWQTVTCSGRSRNHQVMQQARGHERTQRPYCRSKAPLQWLKHPGMRQRVEAHVPTFAPEFAKRSRGERPLHDGLHVDSGSLPGKGDQMERSEMKHQNQSDHACPATEDRIISRNRPCT